MMEMRRMRRDVNLASWLAGWWPASPAGWLAGTGWLAGWLAGLAGWLAGSICARRGGGGGGGGGGVAWRGVAWRGGFRAP